jgi:thiol-disulfide isomerase/thioredoxin
MGFTLGVLAFVWALGSGQSLPSDARAVDEQPSEPFSAERRIVQYIKENMTPGRPVVLTDLYNEVFTTTEERAALSRLNSAFFRLPLFLVEYQAQQGELPTLDEIAEQFDFYGPEEAAVVLSVMESDPRVPNFISRDPDTGELIDLDVDKIRSDSRFNTALERTLSWEGRILPDVGGLAFDGAELRLGEIEEKAVLLYVWFTNCPPCMRMAPELVGLQEDYRARGFTVLGANADRALGLPYGDEERTSYVEKHSLNFPNFYLSEADRAALGSVNIFPTMFLVGADRVVVKYYVNYQPREVIEADLETVLDASASRSDSSIPGG